MQIWEEYCTCDPVDVEELSQVLEMIKASEISKQFGQVIESALPVWKMIGDPEKSYSILKLLVDLQQNNSPALYEIAFAALKNKYKNDPRFEERVRLSGMRKPESYQGGLSNYELLAHMDKGKFVFHGGGWGTGEIIELSLLREQVTIEFEHVGGRKHLSLANAFKGLVPLADDHFLARRFGNADALEKEAKDNPQEIIKLLLKDLGPKTSSEIKDELCELVIPEEEWAKWWQNVRSKLKKDTLIEAPKSIRDPFRLHKTEISHDDRFQAAMKDAQNASTLLTVAYTYVRDFPGILKNEGIKKMLQNRFVDFLNDNNLTDAQALQAYIFLEDYLGHKFSEKKVENLIQGNHDFERIVDAIEILALKKRVLVLVRTHRSDWVEIFFTMFLSNQQSHLRDYLFKELQQNAPELLTQRLQRLLKAPQDNPDVFVWYFQLILGHDRPELPFGTDDGIRKWFEGLLILLHYLEFQPDQRELTKKIYSLLSGKRYALIRKILEGSPLAFAKEFLLLASKCQIFTESDRKILHSLVAVVHPSLTKETTPKHPHSDSQTIWTTEESYRKMQDKVRQLATTDIIAVAKEIEAARALGDLRENSEYKFALEKRSRLQADLKTLSEELGRARIITPADVSKEEVSVGSIVKVRDAKNTELSYTILGPWETDPTRNTLSLQSKLVQAMLGCRKDDKFKFRDEEYRIVALGTIFD